MRNSTKNYLALMATLFAFVAAPQTFAGDYGYYNRSVVDIDIVDDYGRRFKEYPTQSQSYDIKRAYLEAKDGKSYGIKVRNNSNDRIGVVIAVDGRNIISGKKSHLKSNERMYILNPYQRSTYKGWRSGKNRVNEFYFTDVPDSYADRTFGDISAMGVIAVAVFKEKNGHWYREHRDYRNERDHDDRYDDYDRDYSYKGEKRSENQSKQGTNKESLGKSTPQSKNHRSDSYSDEAGTGYGNDRYSPTRRVRFKAKRHASEKHFLKYEWKQTLCEMGVKQCSRRDRNRFWSRHDRYDNYAPPPPSRRYRHYGQGIH